MVALEELREQALQKLACHYAAGDLHLTTLEHRVKEALAAESPDEMTGATWDLPALESSVWERVRFRISRPPAQRPVGRIVFHDVHKLELVMRDPQTWLVGRSRYCDALLLDRSVSRRHALVSFRGGRCSVRDLGSTNGLHVNGHPVDTAVLRPGDVVTIGGTIDAIVR